MEQKKKIIAVQYRIFFEQNDEKWYWKTRKRKSLPILIGQSRSNRSGKNNVSGFSAHQMIHKEMYADESEYTSGVFEDTNIENAKYIRPSDDWGHKGLAKHESTVEFATNS